ncbi:VOC family protein [Oceanobacillus sp. FSL K6-0127]|uniref:VOC family protein n=1 Tax=Oceanobacillus sp. FSL K6-0127 TaxID=2921420 RepID=UPI0030ECBD64
MEKKFFEAPTIHVEEVNINVRDLSNSLLFYEGIMGFQVLEQSEQKAVLTADGKRPILTLEQPKDVTPKQQRTTGLYHFAILLPSRADLAAFLKHFIQTGLADRLGFGASDHVVSEALYFSDPDGNGIEIAHDRPSSAWDWTNSQVTMRTDPLDAEGILAEQKEEWQGMPANTLMGHIHLHVADLDAAEKFYIDGLGFDIVTKYPGALFTSHNGYHHHVAVNVWRGIGAPRPLANSIGLNWYSLVFPDEATRKKTIDQLEQIGADVTNENDAYMTEDPAGNKIKLIVRS